MSNLLTNSRVRTWRDCRRKHHLMYVDGWRPVQLGEALRYGVLIHTGLEAWWKDDGSGRLAAALDAIAGKGFDAYEQVSAEELLAGYDRRWEFEMERYEVLAVERVFDAPLVNPETFAASKTWLMAGKVDAVVRDLRTDRVLLVEHKTTRENIADPVDPYWTKLAMDAQVSHYHVGAQALGYDAEGCLYDVLLRPRLRPLLATPEESRKFKKDRTLYANQRDRDETPEEYRLRVRADVAESPAAYYQRREVPRTDDDLREYLADLWAEGRMIREAELAGRAPRNPDACHRFGACPFWACCAEGARPEDMPEKYERVDDVHPELALDCAVEN